MRRSFFVLVALVALASPAGAADAPPELVVVKAPATASNYARGSRPRGAIRLIVVHTVEGSYGGAIAWFRNPRARVSAHYVVSREGAVAQTVADRRVAWHAGNGRVNRTSIGIEHEGYAWIPGTFTDAQYRASARLVARLARKYGLPINRRHVIGHNEVPDPYRRGRRGGYGHHSDPGPSWDWPRYMTYIRSYASGVEPPPRAFDVTIPGVRLGQRVADVVRWEAAPVGKPVGRVDFFVDRRLRETLRTPPYVLAAGAWETWRERNGRRVLTVRAVSADGHAATASVVVRLSNPPPPRITELNVTEGQTVSGIVRIEAAVAGATQRVELLVDGTVRATLAAPPFAFDWDTATESAGPHRVTIRVVAPNGRPTTRAVTIVVTS